MRLFHATSAHSSVYITNYSIPVVREKGYDMAFWNENTQGAVEIRTKNQ